MKIFNILLVISTLGIACAIPACDQPQEIKAQVSAGAEESSGAVMVCTLPLKNDTAEAIHTTLKKWLTENGGWRIQGFVPCHSGGGDSSLVTTGLVIVAEKR